MTCYVPLKRLQQYLFREGQEGEGGGESQKGEVKEGREGKMVACFVYMGGGGRYGGCVGGL